MKQCESIFTSLIRNDKNKVSLLSGNKVIELEQGKNAIEQSSKAEIEPTLQSIKKAVDNGEFDRLLEEQLAYGSHLEEQ